MSEDPREAGWVRDAQAGSPNAFGRLVQLHQQSLRAFLRRLSGDHAQADDLAQESFVFAWEHLARFDSQRPFRPWLFGIGWRKYQDHQRGWLRLLRRQGRYVAERNEIAQPDQGLMLDLARATAQLPPAQQAAILLCLGLEFTQEEAAAILAMPLGTVKSHIARGREKLVQLLGDSA